MEDNMNLIINPYITFNKIDNEIIIISENGSRIFQLNPLASEIWGLLENGNDTTEIINVLTTRYDADIEIIKNDVQELIRKLINDNLIIQQ